MRKNLLFVLGLVVTMAAFSQIPTETIWSKSFTPITAKDTMPDNQVMTVDMQGSAIVAGKMTKNFTFANKEITALTSKANYIAKYSASGQELWAVVADGANITSITTDANGNIYIAGNFTEAYSLSSTDGNDKEQEGNDYVSSALIAKYNANGVLLKIETIIPTRYNYSDDYWDLPGIEIPQILSANGKIYASISNYGTKVTMGNITLDGRYYNTETIIRDSLDNPIDTTYSPTFKSTTHALVLDDQLVAEKALVTVGMKENSDKTIGGSMNPSFTVDGDEFYFITIGTGTIDVTTSSASKTYTFFDDNINGITGYAFVISAINQTTGGLIGKAYEANYGGYYPLTSPKTVFYKDGNLIITGTYNTEGCPFDKTKTFVGANGDAVIASLNASTLNVNWVVSSTYNEGESKFKNFEELNSAAIFGDELLAMGTCFNKSPQSIGDTYLLKIDLTNGTASAPIASTPNPTINTGIAGNGKNLLSASTTPSENKMTFTMAGEMPDAIGEIENGTTSVTILNTVVKDEIQLSEIADATIINLSGIVVKTVKATDQINVSNLPTGSYFVTINGITTKVQKI